ncbi:uncharacterized protein UV8b_05524 [Ustilaginoidea virens]|uniref:Uncharacterized protein n=1 Tax=Ustilaginoidea virens TaxID=1159556 RepID=A0A8E5HTJ4_USTVR|nr:uncharacterized protein UV8b_05524 [Ustilaginoidea virens]QUC21281.1 hypothetical protein UV8b_05524 [Ustilaginoidea virens]
MKLALELVLLASAAMAASLPRAHCPAKGCYSDPIHPSCPPDRACPQYIISATACPWPCGKAKDAPPVPPGCSQRCKPCKQEVCPLVCQCEIICTSGPCHSSQAVQ